MIADIVRIILPKIYPITDTSLSGLSHRDQVEQLIQGGATLIQLREKRMSPREFLHDAREALTVARSAGVKIIINDRVDVAMVIGADGVHLGQTDMPVKAARRLLGERAIVGFSTHNAEQVDDALHLPINYLAFGPVFPTASKENPDPIVGVDLLSEIKSRAGSLPLIAIGGITKERVPAVLIAGADSVATISALFDQTASITQNLKNLRNLASIDSVGQLS
jgi:thiamine-phosphate pyrophosphorylase